MPRKKQRIHIGRATHVKNSTVRKLRRIPAGYLLLGMDPHKKKHAAVAMTQDAMVRHEFKLCSGRAYPIVQGAKRDGAKARPDRRPGSAIHDLKRLGLCYDRPGASRAA